VGELYVKNIKTGLLALITIAVTVGALWFTNGSVTPTEATWADVEAEAKMGDYKLISIDELWERYRKNADSMLVVDTRQAWEYRSGHIKGAVNFPMEPTWFSRWKKKGALETFLGPDKDRSIIFY
jgi:3-mercaptopyruvate sulfurtransferase SseA